jgi:AraC-like DNA-binding protein
MKVPGTGMDRGDRLVLGYLYGGVVQYQPGEVLPPRLLADFEVVLMLEGRATYRKGDDEHQLEPGSIVLARPGPEETYVWDAEHRTRHAYFHMDIQAVPRDWPDPRDWPVVRDSRNTVLAPMFRHVLQRALAHRDWPARPPGPSDARFVEAFLDVLINPVHEQALRDIRDRPEPVRLALKWMREVLDEDPGRRVTLHDLAAVAHVSEKHLCRVFTETLGSPPILAFRLLRLQLALALLARSNLTVKEVALRSGFEDPLYFSRCFSKTFGQSPRETRRRLRAGQPPPPSPLPTDITPRVYW